MILRPSYHDLPGGRAPSDEGSDNDDHLDKIRKRSRYIPFAFRAVLNFLMISAFYFQTVQCYIPAVPSNDSLSTITLNSTIANVTSQNFNWVIQLNWQPMGIFSDGVTLQLKADNSNETIHQGVLLHFSEVNSTSQTPVIVPWIAMINCDSNSSSYSMQDDIFTLARDRGARAAMIYSLHSTTCQVNQEFLDNFEKPLDVFSSGNLQGSRLIESQFSNVLGSGYWFQSDLLNASTSNILQQMNSTGLPHDSQAPLSPSSEAGNGDPNNPITRPSKLRKRTSRLIARSDKSKDGLANPIQLSINSPNRIHHNGSPTLPNYLIATLANSDSVSLAPQAPTSGKPRFRQSSGDDTHTGLATIILYAITGCVTFMFLIVIVSGAIRAFRNPERYGPRPGARRYNPDTGQDDVDASTRQTRAAGLTKAILDTFPVVKFGRSNTGRSVNHRDRSCPQNKDLKAGDLCASQQEIIVMQDRSGRSQPTATSFFLPKTMFDGSIPGDQLDGTHEESPSSDTTDLEGNIPGSQLPLMTTQKSELPLTLWSHLDEPGGDGNGVTIEVHAVQLPLLDTSMSFDSPTEREASFVPGEGETSKPGRKSLELFIDCDPPTEESIDGNHDDESPDSHNIAEHEGNTDLVDVNNSITCPICVYDFVEGDDIRVLPCDARHRFHKECVDPWLLNESRFCPLCRWDLSTRKDGTKITDASLSRNNHSQQGDARANISGAVASSSTGMTGLGITGLSGSSSVPMSNYDNTSRESLSHSVNLDAHNVRARSAESQDPRDPTKKETETRRRGRWTRTSAQQDELAGKAGKNRFMKYLSQVRRRRKDN